MCLKGFEVRDKFDIQGFFYEIGKYKCRKYLDMRNNESNSKKPDLMVVMMNPGSSYPLDGIDNNNSPSEAVPDNTQDQIMKVMLNNHFDYARVLNLSDLRTPDSNELYRFIKSEKSKEIDHSIFGQNRKSDFESLYIKDIPVIYGWGVNPALTGLSKLAIEAINHSNPVGLRKSGSGYAYYHPLPRIYEKQLEWVEKVSQMLSRT
jgi:hypothetical protein